MLRKATRDVKPISALVPPPTLRFVTRSVSSALRTGRFRGRAPVVAGLVASPPMPTAFLGITAGIAAALSFGAGDFSGGLAARRAGGLLVAAAVQWVGLLALLVGAVVLRPDAPDVGALGIGLAAGVAGGIGLAALYAGLALGAMGLVTALSSLGSVVIPVLVGALTGTVLAPLQLAGVALAAIAAMTAGGASRAGVSRAALALAGVAAVAFGSWYVLLDLAAERRRSAVGPARQPRLFGRPHQRRRGRARASVAACARWRRSWCSPVCSTSAATSASWSRGTRSPSGWRRRSAACIRS